MIKIHSLRKQFLNFILSCRLDDAFSLTAGGSKTPFALCFAIFGLNLLKQKDILENNKHIWDKALRQNISIFRLMRRIKCRELNRDKPFLQLLCFTLSSLAILKTLRNDPLEKEVVSLLPSNLEDDLALSGAFLGMPGSGNYAMFLAILLLHAQKYLGLRTSPQIEQWLELLGKHRNKFGFWGDKRGMTHLQFQNGYHQYEILEYLGVREWDWRVPAEAVASLADVSGQFAPYPGGGGCYDYDAIFILTGRPAVTEKHRKLLVRTAETLLRQQNPDGGFCESHRIRPRNWKNWSAAFQHIARAQGPAFWERLRLCLSLQQPQYNRVRNHWSVEPYDWKTSDLWNSWFRMLTLARIEVALEPSLASRWGFINYPGIGHHHSLSGG